MPIRSHDHWSGTMTNLVKSKRQWLSLLSIIIGAVLFLVGLFADIFPRSDNSYGIGQLALTGLGAITIVAGVAITKMSTAALKKCVFCCVGCTLIFFVAEVMCSIVAYSLTAHYMDSFMIFEESGRTFHLDSVRGYRLTRVPSRFARITKGTVEYVGAYKGNTQGFPDRDDFSIKTPAHISKRYIVFGDSFTSAQFIQTNWPEALEQQFDGRVEFLNFSTDGGGLANWWSNLANVVDRESYDCDGVIFAVYAGDLKRRFTIIEHRGYDRHMFGRLPTWNPAEFPTSPAEAEIYLRPVRDCFIVSKEEFSTALSRKRLARRQSEPIGLKHLWITYNSYKSLQASWNSLQGRIATDRTEARFSEGQRALILDIRERLNARKIHPIVVYISPIEDLLNNFKKSPPYYEAREFSRVLGARFVDGNEAFAGLSPEVIQKDWLPYDGHWAQRGSDRFAHFLAALLREELGE